MWDKFERNSIIKKKKQAFILCKFIPGQFFKSRGGGFLSTVSNIIHYGSTNNHFIGKYHFITLLMV